MNAGIIRKAIVAAAVSLSVATVATSVTATPVAAQTVSAKSASLPKLGESGPEVTRMQQAIVARGFTIKGGIDGQTRRQTNAEAPSGRFMTDKPKA